MKTVLLIAVSLLFAASAFAQPAAQPATKVMFVNTNAFRAKDGITKYTNAVAALNTEFAPYRTELQNMATRHDALAKEVAGLQDQINKATVNKDALIKQLDDKVEEGQTLEVQIKRKQEDTQKRIDRRQSEVMDPIRQDIAKALGDFGRQRGYAVILDIAKLAEAILMYDETKADVTRDFITFYNARSPTAAPKP
jgi:Skp family chaperone for outer membrane proteins